MQDAITLCENCESAPAISSTDGGADLCAECELALIDELAAHDEDCQCLIDEENPFVNMPCDHPLDCPACTCEISVRVERRKIWLRKLTTKPQP